MKLALFPDQQQVLLQRNAAAAPSGDHHTPYSMPMVEDLRSLGYEPARTLRPYGTLEGVDVSGAMVNSPRLQKLLVGGQARHLKFELVSRRVAADLMDVDEFWQMNRAFHLCDWDNATRFCGACASPMDYSTTDTAKICPSCGRQTYPQIAPAVIMAIVRDGNILLAHNSRHPGRLFSVLAGFVEPGETLERAVAREVEEESGVRVRDIEYFSSQPWPFPNSIMVAFTCKWASGDAHSAEAEIEEIDWFAPGDLPAELPGRFSVARRLIEWFVSTHGSSDDLQNLLTRSERS